MVDFEIAQFILFPLRKQRNLSAYFVKH